MEEEKAMDTEEWVAQEGKAEGEATEENGGETDRNTVSEDQKQTWQENGDID